MQLTAIVATRDNVRILGMDDKLGTVEVGKLADVRPQRDERHSRHLVVLGRRHAQGFEDLLYFSDVSQRLPP